MKLEYPLNDALPNIEHTRDRLLAKVFQFRQTARGKLITNDEDYELLYAYGKLWSFYYCDKASSLTCISFGNWAAKTQS